MLKFLVVALFVTTFSSCVFGAEERQQFHRLLALNEEGKLLVVRIREPKVWVTPGLYAKEGEDITSRLTLLASEYGLVGEAPNMRGRFILKDGEGNESVRIFYVMKAAMKEAKKPDAIDAVEWLPINDALALITFPHIRILVEQIDAFPNQKWGATVMRFRQEEQHEAKLVTPFFVLDEQVESK